jgi:hypothetical protein
MSNMLSRRIILAAALALSVTAGATTLALRAADDKSSDQAAKEKGSGGRYFEMRTYHAAPGKLDALNARFRNHTVKLFKKHGMESIGYWTPAADRDGAGNTLVYILAYPSKEAADASWKAFRADPDWIKAKGESEQDGPLVEKVDSVYLNPTDYSPMK